MAENDKKLISKHRKHAYCIMAHSDQYCLSTLISLLDHEDNDIFIHIDKKSKELSADELKTTDARLFIIPKDESVDVRWGGLSQVSAELLLFDKALKTEDYNFIHLLSGADLPLKSQEDIHRFFNSFPKGTNFIAFSEGENIMRNVEFKTRFYHPFIEFQRFRKDGNLFHLLQDTSAKLFRKIIVKTQQVLKIRRNWENLVLKKGSQWVSISSDFAKYLVENKNLILSKFRRVICPDEIFVQTMIYNSPFRSTIVNQSILNKQQIRYIDWKRGNPYTWKDEDFKELCDSECLFARKFSSVTDKGIIDKIKKLASDK